MYMSLAREKIARARLLREARAAKSKSLEKGAKTEPVTLKSTRAAYPTHTVGPADVIEFTTNLEANLKSYSIDISPVQDLHGYDSPWPAGGGKNKLSLGDKTFVQYQEYEIAEIPAGTYVFSAVVTSTDTDSDTCDIIFLDADKNTIATKTLSRSVGSARVSTSDFTISVPIKYVRLYAGASYPSGAGDTATFTDNMIELGSTATAWTPYSNICPITGWTGAEVTRTGKNLLDEANRTESSNSTIQYSRLENRILLKAGYSYTLSVSVAAAQLAFYKAGGGVLGVNYGKSSLTYTPTEDVYAWFEAYYGGNYPPPQGGISAVICQLELGSTASSYEPYTGDTYSITFPSSAGTVYGGTLTVNEDGTGELVVDRAKYQFTGSETWGFTSGFFYTNLLPAGLNKNDYYLSENGVKMYLNGNNGQCRIYLTGNTFLTSDSDINGYLTNEIGVLYELATPLTYTLTALQVISTLLGSNVLFADAGEMSAEYYYKDTSKPTPKEKALMWWRDHLMWGVGVPRPDFWKE